MLSRKKLFTTIAIAAGYAISGQAHAQVDHLQVIVDRLEASGTNSLASYGYSPATDTAYTATFGAGAAIRGITDVDGLQSSTILVSEGQLQSYYREGNPDRGVSSPIVSGIVLNPKPVGPFPAHSFAIITDSGFTRLPATTTTDPAATKRVYRFNLQPVGPAGPTPPPYGDARDVMTTLVTLADMAVLQGSPTSTSSNTGRQGAFSNDGQSFYFIDSSTNYGGVYKTDALTGVTALLLDSGDINTEPGILPAPGGGDRILFQGTAANNNVGGLSYIDHNTATSSEQVLISAADLANFLQKPVGDANIFSVTTDAAGNVYFFDTDADVMVRRDPQGRLSKVTTNVERQAFRDQLGKTGNVNGNMLRLQPRTITHPTAGPITQVLYAEQTAQNYIAGVYAFEAGDFNRDSLRTAADIDLFKPILTTRGIPLAGSANFKFDMNGNAVVDWKDVKILQTFFDFGDGDVNINGLVDFADFQILQNNFGATGRTFIQGDLDGDDDVDFSDFQLLQNSFGHHSSILGTDLAAAPFDQAQWDAFAASVPEPATLSILGLAAVGLLRRRRA